MLQEIKIGICINADVRVTIEKVYFDPDIDRLVVIANACKVSNSFQPLHCVEDKKFIDVPYYYPVDNYVYPAIAINNEENQTFQDEIEMLTWFDLTEAQIEETKNELQLKSELKFEDVQADFLQFKSLLEDFTLEYMISCPQATAYKVISLEDTKVWIEDCIELNLLSSSFARQPLLSSLGFYANNVRIVEPDDNSLNKPIEFTL